MRIKTDQEMWDVIIREKRETHKASVLDMVDWIEDRLIHPRDPTTVVAPTSVLPHAVTPQKNGESAPTSSNAPGAECPVCAARRDAKRAQMAKARAARKGAKASAPGSTKA